VWGFYASLLTGGSVDATASQRDSAGIHQCAQLPQVTGTMSYYDVVLWITRLGPWGVIFMAVSRSSRSIANWDLVQPSAPRSTWVCSMWRRIGSPGARLCGRGTFKLFHRHQ